ncbi:MAG TPA: HAD family phosphatase [bacterium]|nr:HAD family phosphatase [bacterium]
MTKDSLRAILFDFDGVLADSEPLHLEMFQKVLQEEGISLSREDYYEKYLGLDDRGCFYQVFRDAGRVLDEPLQLDLIRRKNRAFLEHVRGRPFLMPGVAEAVQRLKGRYFLTIVSGALRSEIVAILEGARLEKAFHAVIAAEDVAQGKPNPEGFLSAIRLLNRDFVPPAEILLPGECLAVEDSPWGIEAAKAAGVKCLAVATSYDPSRLAGADLIAKDIASILWEKAKALFSA